MTLRTTNYGGGGQSTGLLVAAATGLIDFPTFLFANVGDDSEDPRTLEYVRTIAMPYAEAHGIALHELRATRGDGSLDTVWRRVWDEKRMAIPVRRSRGGKPMSRSCTQDLKAAVCRKWRREHGATKNDPAVVAIGYSTDEVHRAHNKVAKSGELLVFPLLDDLHMSRLDCENLIASAGLPLPPKSACWFCPYRSLRRWQELRDERPHLFEQAVAMEAGLSEKWGPVYLTRFGVPLRDAVGTDVQGTLDFDDAETCDDGACFT